MIFTFFLFSIFPENILPKIYTLLEVDIIIFEKNETKGPLVSQLFIAIVQGSFYGP